MDKTAEYNIHGKCLIIKLNEDLDHHNAEEIRINADKLIEINRIVNVIFDFSNVKFMDSSGIGVIMGRYRKVHYDNGRIIVVGLNKIIGRIFKMSALYKIAEIYEDVDVAIRELKENRDVY